MMAAYRDLNVALLFALQEGTRKARCKADAAIVVNVSLVATTRAAISQIN